MSLIQKLLQLIKNLFFEKEKLEPEGQKGQKNTGKLSMIHWILLLACLGLAAMILHNYFSIQQDVLSPMSPAEGAGLSQKESDAAETLGSSRDGPETMQEYEELYETKLKEILGKIVGVGEVSVFVNLDSTEEVVVQQNTRTQHSTTKEQDREGGSRDNQEQVRDEQAVIIRNDNGEAPLVVMRKKPQVRGVVVVASGADNIQVKTWIAEAVQRVLDVPLHKISVLPKKS